MYSNFIPLLVAVAAVNAHIAAFHKGMYCLNGFHNEENLNSAEVSNPLHDLTFDEFWLRGKCKDFPPADGDFLDLPAGGTAMLELSSNRGLTTLSYDGRWAKLFADRDDHPELDDPSWPNHCVSAPNLHTENRTRAAGTVLAIAYKSNIYDVRPEDMVVISVLEHTPWHREAEYEIPKDLPGCDDCTCAWSWIPNGCGQANMYINPFRCRVTGAREDAPKIGKPLPAEWCEDDKSKCRTGPKQITIWRQKEGVDNVHVDGIVQADGQWAFPTYNEKMGFYTGAQNDIFEDAVPSSDPSEPTTSTSTEPSTSTPTDPATSSSSTDPATPSESPTEPILNPLPSLPPMPHTRKHKGKKGKGRHRKHREQQRRLSYD